MRLSAEELGTVGVRHAFDLLGSWVHESGAQQVCLLATDESACRPLLDRVTIPRADKPTDISVYLFTLERLQAPFESRVVVGCFHNELSYRRLLHPSMPVHGIRRLRKSLAAQGYSLEKLVGIYPPVFLAWWVMSLLAGPRFPDLHFRWEQIAVDRVATSCNPAVLFSHIVLFYARRLES